MTELPNLSSPALQSGTTRDPMLSPRIPVTPDKLFSLRSPGDVDLSPDGKRVAFDLAEWVPDQPKQRKRAWVVDTAGGEPEPFTRGLRESYCPRWSPDGTQLAFIGVVGSEEDKDASRDKGSKDKSGSEESKEKGKPQLYLMSTNGGEARRVCTMPNGVSDLAWSPDGKRIAFLSLEGEEPKSDPKVIGPARHNRLWTVRPGSDTPEPGTPDGVTVWEYAWSPDSRQFALYFSMGPEENDWYTGQVGVVPAIGGAVRQVTHLTCQASALTWSPDGTRIAYISGDWSDRSMGGGDIFVLPVEGGESHNLTPGILSSPSWCRWFPDGRRLLYTCYEGVTHQVGIVDEAGGTTIQVIVEDFVMAPFWPHLSTTPDLQRFATIHSDAEHPADVWFGELTSENATAADVTWRRLTRMNPIPEETFAIARTERIRYESVDGWQIDALFTHPLEHKGNSLPPLVVSVHGGPSWAWCDSYNLFWTQYLASAGYAVLQPNIRGSWGRGAAFADAVVEDMGGKDFQDVLRGVDYLVARGLVDGNRVGIEGWSYGGFMTAWAVTQTTRFKAAMMGAGVSDWHNFHAQSNLSVWDMRFLGADPLEHPELYHERSAITYAARVTTPTLILHGENDEAVPVAQAYAFYRALHERNVPVEMVVYPREGHGPSERDHIRDVTERILRWFERYLKNA